MSITASKLTQMIKMLIEEDYSAAMKYIPREAPLLSHDCTDAEYPL